MEGPISMTTRNTGFYLLAPNSLENLTVDIPGRSSQTSNASTLQTTETAVKILSVTKLQPGFSASSC